MFFDYTRQSFLALIFWFLLYNPDKTPALGLAIRPALRNLNNVADTTKIVLVMNAERRSTPYVLAIFRMPDLKVNSNLDAFVAAAAYHHRSLSFRLSILHLRFPIILSGALPS
jgi:hypothetical protein